MNRDALKIIDDYQSAIRANYGDEIAEKSYFDYIRGWFYFSMAQRFPDGSCRVISDIHGHQAYRKKEIVLRTIELWRRYNEQRKGEVDE